MARRNQSDVANRESLSETGELSDAWLSGTDPTSLLALLPEGVSPRKLRLISCSCCRHIWPLLTDPRTRRAVEAAEQFADGRITAEQLIDVGEGARDAASETRDHASQAAVQAATVWHGKERQTAVLAAGLALKAARNGNAASRTVTQDEAALCTLIRDIIGDPFQPAPHIDPQWLSWKDGEIVHVARSIYDAGDFDRMPLLASLLEQSGCHVEPILTHLRSGERHARGCWVLAGLLGLS